MLDLVRLPAKPASAALDASWNACLVDAAAKHLQVGRDVVFTYGPLGHLLAYHHIGQAMGGRMLFECGFVILTVLGIVACAMRLPGRWAAALVFAAGFGPAIEFRDVPVGISLACWAVTCHVAGPRPGAAAALGLGLLVGISALLKFSWCVAGGFTAVGSGAAPAGHGAGARRALFAAWTAAFTFVTWKHGFVRADFGHLLCFHGVACVLPIALLALPSATPRLASVRRGAALIALIVLLGSRRSTAACPRWRIRSASSRFSMPTGSRPSRVRSCSCGGATTPGHWVASWPSTGSARSARPSICAAIWTVTSGSRSPCAPGRWPPSARRCCASRASASG